MNVKNKILLFITLILSMSCSKIDLKQDYEYEYSVFWTLDNELKTEIVLGTEESQVTVKKIKRIAKKDNDRYQLLWWYDEIQYTVLDECEEWNKFNDVTFYKIHK
jgi:hypothetical protein